MQMNAQTATVVSAFISRIKYRSMSTENVLEVDENVDSYLIESSIPTVRAYEQKIRNAIETQKQELRTLVGEQYQELISAADAIIKMSKNAQTVQSNFDKMQLDCNVEAIKNNARRSMKSKDRGTRHRANISAKRKYIYVIAALVKSLADVPEQIWHALENHRYLHASRLYSLAKKVNDYLEEEKQRSTVDIDLAFPVIQRQWDAVSLFEPQIIQRATHYLRVSEQSSEHMAEIAVGLMLLDGLSYADSLEKLLEMRTAVIQDTLLNCAKSSSMENRIIHQLREITLIISRTVLSTYEIFVSKENGHKNTLIESYVMSFKKTFLIPSKLSHGNETPTQPAVTRLFSPSSNVHLIVRYLPESIQKYTPEFNPEPLLQPSDVRQLLEKWIGEIKKLLEQKLPEILSTIKSQADLVNIRSKLWTVLDTDENAKVATNNKWQSTTIKLLGKPYSIWDNLYRTAFNNRARSLIDGHLREIAVQPRTLIWPLIIDAEQSMLKKEFSVTVNIWPSFSTSKHFNAFTLPNFSSSKEIQTFKSALTETVNDRTRLLGKLQNAFDETLEKTRKDMQAHIRFETTSNDLFHAASDATALKEHYQNCCYASVLEFCEGLNSLMEQLNSLDWMDKTKKNLVSIFLGRLARNISLLSKELPRSITVSTASSDTTAMFETRSKTTQDPKVSEIQEHLLHTFRKAHDPWLSFLNDKFTVVLEETLNLSKWNDDCPGIKTWEDVEDNIRLPTNASSAIVRDLFSICEEVQHINSTILDQIILDKLKQLLLDSVTNVYAEHVNRVIDKGSLTENGAIQMLFDYLFLITVLKKQDIDSTEGEVELNLQKQIDPTQWASFESHLRANVRQFFTKQALILRVLTGGGGQLYERTKKIASS